MRYENFVSIWQSALKNAGFQSIRPHREQLDVQSLTRTVSVLVEPRGSKDAEPFYVTAELSFSWSPLMAARTHTTEEDMVTELYGTRSERFRKTSPPWLRVDVILHASHTVGVTSPLRSTADYARWMRELTARLERITPLLPPKSVRRKRNGDLEVLAFKDDPELHFGCGHDGRLKGSSPSQ